MSVMDAQLINPFLKSTIQIFEQMFELSPEPGELYKENRLKNHRWEISGIISIIGNHFGLVVIRFPRYLSNKLLEKSGLDYDNEETREQLVNEMVGEITNIISGNALGELADKGYDIGISPPVVVQGKNHRLDWPVEVPIIGLPFITESGPFLVNIGMS